MSNLPFVSGETQIYIENVRHRKKPSYDKYKGPLHIEEMWVELDLIPPLPDNGLINDNDIVGKVRFIKDRILSEIPGSYSSKFELPENGIKFVILGDKMGTCPHHSPNKSSYAPVIKDKNGNIIPYEPHVWFFDRFHHCIEFTGDQDYTLYDIPNIQPLTISFYQYIGATVLPIDNNPGCVVWKCDKQKSCVGIERNNLDIINRNSETLDFVFGSPDLDDTKDSVDDARFLFDKSKAAWRAGRVTNSQWDDVNRGFESVAMGFNSTAAGNNSVVSGGNANTVCGESSVITGGGLNSIDFTSSNSVINGGQNNSINNSQRSVIICGEFNASRETSYSFIGNGKNNLINKGNHCVILSGEGQNINNESSKSAIICGDKHNILSSTGSIIIGGKSNLIDDANNSMIFGVNNVIRHSDNIMFGNVEGAECMKSTSNNQFTCRFGAGSASEESGARLAYRFFTNSESTTGATLASGASSWGAVSDRNLKENITELDHEDTLKHLSSIPIYSYNYIGADEEVVCRGPVAQDWYEHFPTKKDQLRIETMDLDGVALSAVKGLLGRLNKMECTLQDQNNELEKTKLISENNMKNLIKAENKIIVQESQLYDQEKMITKILELLSKQQEQIKILEMALPSM